MPTDTTPDTTTAPATPAPAPAAPAAPARPVIPTAQAAGQAAVTAKLLVKATAETPQVHDVTPTQNVIHRLTYSAAQAIALLAAMDPAAPAGKGAEKIGAQVGPNGEVYFTVTYKA